MKNTVRILFGYTMLSCGGANPTFSHVNANVSVLIDRIRNRFQEMNYDNDLYLHSTTSYCRVISWT